MALESVTAATFKQEVLQSAQPVLVALMSDRSQVCRQLQPRLEDVGRDLAGKLRVVKVNTDASPELVQAFQVKQVPTLVVIVGGRPVNSGTGLLSKQEILDLVEPHLPGAEDEIPAKELPRLLQARQVVVVDVRDAAVFKRAHVPGARSVPIDDLEAHAEVLAGLRKPIVVYDRSGGEVARKAFETLSAMGLPAALLKGGFLGWEAEGFEIERSS